MKLAELHVADDELPISQDALNDKLPLMDFVEKIRKELDQAKSITIDVRELADANKLLGTQSNTDDNDLADDPVFPELHLPVIFESVGIGYVIDGHHRLNKAYRSYAKIKVFWFSDL